MIQYRSGTSSNAINLGQTMLDLYGHDLDTEDSTFYSSLQIKQIKKCMIFAVFLSNLSIMLEVLIMAPTS